MSKDYLECFFLCAYISKPLLVAPQSNQKFIKLKTSLYHVLLSIYNRPSKFLLIPDYSALFLPLEVSIPVILPSYQSCDVPVPSVMSAIVDGDGRDNLASLLVG